MERAVGPGACRLVAGPCRRRRGRERVSRGVETGRTPGVALPAGAVAVCRYARGACDRPRDRFEAGITTKVISRTGTRSGETPAKVPSALWRGDRTQAWRGPLPGGAVAACRYARGACDRPRDRVGVEVMAKVISRTGTRSGERLAKAPSALWSFHAPASSPCVALLVKNGLPSRLGRKLSRRPARQRATANHRRHGSKPDRVTRQGRVGAEAPVPSRAVWRPAAFGVEQQRVSGPGVYKRCTARRRPARPPRSAVPLPACLPPLSFPPACFSVVRIRARLGEARRALARCQGARRSAGYDQLVIPGTSSSSPTAGAGVHLEHRAHPVPDRRLRGVTADYWSYDFENVINAMPHAAIHTASTPTR